MKLEEDLEAGKILRTEDLILGMALFDKTGPPGDGRLRISVMGVSPILGSLPRFPAAKTGPPMMAEPRMAGDDVVTATTGGRPATKKGKTVSRW